MEKRDLESILQRKCQKLLTDNGAFVFKTHADEYSRRGIPDLVACIPVTKEALEKMLADEWYINNKIGLFVAFETKREKDMNYIDTRRRAQQIVAKQIKNSGGLAFFVCDTGDVKAIIDLCKGEF